jgi:hypothetical protein
MTMALIGLVLLALAVGFLGGSVLSGRAGAPGPQQEAAAPAGGTVSHDGHTHAPGAPCVHELPAEHAPILAGLVCNCKEAACNQTPLLACHCATAHSIKDLTKQMIVEGTEPQKIPEELEKRWGSLRPTK